MYFPLTPRLQNAVTAKIDQKHHRGVGVGVGVEGEKEEEKEEEKEGEKEE